MRRDVSSKASPKVAMMMGGPSSERAVSLSSGRECGAALRAEGFEVIDLDAGPDLAARLEDLRPDVVFNALHGRWGEDGCVQGLLEWLRIPYTHSGVLASALAMDKERTKAAYTVAGLPIATSGLYTRAQIAARHVMPPPYVIKPYNEGSSVGVYLVPEGAEAAPELADDLPDTLMVEAFVPGRELTVTVQGDRALCVTDIVTEGWYDYDAKYVPGGSRHVLPAEVPGDVYDACMAHAETAHRVLGCRGISRTDFRWDPRRSLDGLALLETNTQPGMTPTSLTPEQAQHVGLGFGALCRWIVEDASCDR
ncbi:D-alanine--D-alanine ligase [Dinoroseobacter sp. PD6]|uniref:D-alanine--D-alanine ligase n=1 Tax=Dinoroseobacter sp. PD6 TaxID=3028384 RepID=UPI00237B04D3|nr:D-alanine--D-alanine ligase [Dinoroseobacter sp. PD6]MDD9716331.1 D-alanine--D-alanine ligase [Dinoroseobacter sp. PD6]